MAVQLQREIEKLKGRILTLSALVEERVRLAVKAIIQQDEALARQVIDGDAEIDQMEVDLEEECLKVLALHQPVAIDLRYIIAVLKINSDLERIGDLAINIAERVPFLHDLDFIPFPLHLDAMAENAQAMLHSSLDALVGMDKDLAYRVMAADDAVDTQHSEMYAKVEAAIRRDVRNISSLMPLLGISRNLERIADHATNIAEDVIYMISGEIVRHKAESMGGAGMETIKGKREM
jgi:phosphate transport system protein